MAADLGPVAISLGECKAFLRLDHDSDDGVLAGFIRTAMALCEAFTGQWLIVRSGEQRLAAHAGWQRLAIAPVVEIIGVASPAGGLPADAYEAMIGADGSAAIRLLALPVPEPVTVTARAGIGADWNTVPEPLRQGIIRLVAHFYTHRDAADAGPPPAAVAALWRPWRRMRLA